MRRLKKGGRVNHYFSKSMQEFYHKLSRGRADTGGRYDADQMIERNKLFDHIRDTAIFPFARSLQAADGWGR